MAFSVRRVVTGHDANGRAVVKIDEVAKNKFSNRPGATAYVIWTTESFPVDNGGDEDGTTGLWKRRLVTWTLAAIGYEIMPSAGGGPANAHKSCVIQKRLTGNADLRQI